MSGHKPGFDQCSLHILKRIRDKGKAAGVVNTGDEVGLIPGRTIALAFDLDAEEPPPREDPEYVRDPLDLGGNIMPGPRVPDPDVPLRPGEDLAKT